MLNTDYIYLDMDFDIADEAISKDSSIGKPLEKAWTQLMRFFEWFFEKVKKFMSTIAEALTGAKSKFGEIRHKEMIKDTHDIISHITKVTPYIDDYIKGLSTLRDIDERLFPEMHKSLSKKLQNEVKSMIIKIKETPTERYLYEEMTRQFENLDKLDNLISDIINEVNESEIAKPKLYTSEYVEKIASNFWNNRFKDANALEKSFKISLKTYKKEWNFFKQSNPFGEGKKCISRMQRLLTKSSTLLRYMTIFHNLLKSLTDKIYTTPEKNDSKENAK